MGHTDVLGLAAKQCASAGFMHAGTPGQLLLQPTAVGTVTADLEVGIVKLCWH